MTTNAEDAEGARASFARTDVGNFKVTRLECTGTSLPPKPERKYREKKGPFVISHESALEFHRQARIAAARGEQYPALKEIPRTQSGGVSAKKLRKALGITSCLSFLVTDAASRVHSNFVANHVAQNIGPVMPICRDLYVSSPEEALFQICQEHNTVKPLLYAYELCGTFAICKDEKGGFVNDIPPLLAPEQIGVYVDQRKGNRASAKFRTMRQVLASLVPGAASPAEAKLCLAICAPRKIGGQGLAKPELNAELQVTGEARTLTQRNTIRPDELWEEQKVILEYLGSHHAEEARMGEDASRDNALAAMGYKVIHVTKRQVKNPDLYRGLMQHLGAELGARQTMPTKGMLASQEHLRSVLFGSKCKNSWRGDYPVDAHHSAIEKELYGPFRPIPPDYIPQGNISL